MLEDKVMSLDSYFIVCARLCQTGPSLFRASSRMHKKASLWFCALRHSTRTPLVRLALVEDASISFQRLRFYIIISRGPHVAIWHRPTHRP